MTSLETSILVPLIILIVVMQVLGLRFFFVAQVRTSEAMDDFYHESGRELLRYGEVADLTSGPFESGSSFQQLQTSGWELLRWGIVASDLTRMITGRVLP